MPGNADPEPRSALPRVAGRGRRRHQPRTVAVAHRRSASRAARSRAEVGVGVNRDGRDLELRAGAPLVQRLDVGQLVDVAQVAGVDLALGERVEHERVVGIGAVGDADGAGHGTSA